MMVDTTFRTDKHDANLVGIANMIKATDRYRDFDANVTISQMGHRAFLAAAATNEVAMIHDDYAHIALVMHYGGNAYIVVWLDFLDTYRVMFVAVKDGHLRIPHEYEDIYAEYLGECILDMIDNDDLDKWL